MFKSIIISVFILSAILISSCTGPAGPAGPKGNANVKTYTYFVNYDDWDLNNNLFTYDIDIDDINENIFYNGYIAVYIWENGMIPFQRHITQEWIDGTNRYWDLYYRIGIGGIMLNIYFYSDSEEVKPYLPIGGTTIKVVLIPGEKANILQKKGIDLKNYNEVKKELNIIDK